MIKKHIRRLILISIVSCQYFLVLGQNSNSSEKIDYEKRIISDTINGVYIPKDFADCKIQLDKLLSDSIKLEIKKMTESEFTSNVHHGLGMWLRNNWGLWAGSRLQIYMTNLKFTHPDEMSDFLLTCYHKSLQGNRINIKKEIRKYRDKYKYLTKQSRTIFKAKTIDKKEYIDLDSALIFADKIVELSFQNYGKLSNKILVFKNLNSINIENCPKLNWHKTFKLLKRFPHLKELSLFRNQIVNYPDEIGLLSNLTNLWIGSDSIKLLPTTIGKLTNLKELMISECPKIELSTLLNQLVGLDSLTELHLSDDSLRTIPIEINKLYQLKELRLDDNLLAEIPQGIKALKNLTYLSLFSNKIQKIDLVKGDLFNLTGINLCYNEFTEFPVALTKLENLESIVMWYNQIERVPDEISDLVNLKRLNLESNNLTNLPSSFCHLTKLEKFEFRSNNFTDSVFSILLCLKQIKVIGLSNNKIQQIPSTISELENLENLELSGNEALKTIPKTFSKFSKLKSLGFGNCPNLDFDNVCDVLKQLNLEQLGFYGNKLSDEKRKKLNTLLPKTKIYY